MLSATNHKNSAPDYLAKFASIRPTVSPHLAHPYASLKGTPKGPGSLSAPAKASPPSVIRKTFNCLPTAVIKNLATKL